MKKVRILYRGERFSVFLKFFEKTNKCVRSALLSNLLQYLKERRFAEKFSGLK
jgi:hypothetical protein